MSLAGWQNLWGASAFLESGGQVGHLSEESYGAGRDDREGEGHL